MKTSFIATILNEEGSIGALLDSLLLQTKMPDEVILVDAGSTDNTVSIVRKHPLKSKLIIKKGIMRSTARNLAINKAQHSIIVVSDAGNRLDDNWLKFITAPFKNKNIDSVAGFYLTDSKNLFQKSVAPFVAVMPDQLNIKTFLPSSRSLAFRKSAWKKVKGYPEPLNTCEDLVFASRLKQMTQMIVKPQAIAYWRQVENTLKFFKMIKNHTTGDVQARYQPHLKKIATIYLRYILFFIMPFLFPFYLIYPIFKFYHYVKNPLALIYLPILQLTKDLSIIIGSLQGLVKKSKSR